MSAGELFPNVVSRFCTASLSWTNCLRIRGVRSRVFPECFSRFLSFCCRRSSRERRILRSSRKILENEVFEARGTSSRGLGARKTRRSAFSYPKLRKRTRLVIQNYVNEPQGNFREPSKYVRPLRSSMWLSKKNEKNRSGPTVRVPGSFFFHNRYFYTMFCSIPFPTLQCGLLKSSVLQYVWRHPTSSFLATWPYHTGPQPYPTSQGPPRAWASQHLDPCQSTSRHFLLSAHPVHFQQERGKSKLNHRRTP